ncbi:MAG: hypothetical protein M0Q13_02490 [Methanothrix sp.]|jgi:hypothetical protein|nr:hypothetical protein [Methanothrix sp.]
MADTNLKKNGNELLEKIRKEYDLLKAKIKGVDYKVAAQEDLPSYEKFMPIVEKFQEDLFDITDGIHKVIEELNSDLETMFSGIEKELEIIDNSISEDSEEIIDESDESNIGELEGPKITSDLDF